jgi:quercetin dioxygenase-like cupin family protein
VLAGVSDANCVELWEWRLVPGESHPSADHAPGTRELLHVLAGLVTVTVDGADYEVRSGQTIAFHADRWHAYRNAGADPARLLMVVVMPPGELDRRRR